VWTPVGIICRPTQKEADDYIEYVVTTPTGARSGTWRAMAEKPTVARASIRSARFTPSDPAERRALARGSYCVIGDPTASRANSPGSDRRP
jgi:hypothetical protein